MVSLFPSSDLPSVLAKSSSQSGDQYPVFGCASRSSRRLLGRQAHVYVCACMREGIMLQRSLRSERAGFTSKLVSRDIPQAFKKHPTTPNGQSAARREGHYSRLYYV